MKRSRICLINLSNRNIIPFLLVPLARLNLKTGFFQASWFHRFTWIHYDATDDSAFCFLCCKAVKGIKMGLARLSEASFLGKLFIIGRMLLEFWLNMKAVTSTKQQLKHWRQPMMWLTCCHKQQPQKRKKNVNICWKSSHQYVSWDVKVFLWWCAHMIWIPTSISYCFWEQMTFKALMLLHWKNRWNTLLMIFSMNYFQSCLYKLFIKLLAKYNLHRLHRDDWRSYGSC